VITCQQFVAELQDFLEGSLGEDRHAAAAEHLAGCRDCQAFADSYQKVMQMGRRLPAPVPSPRFLERLKAALEKKPPEAAAG